MARARIARPYLRRYAFPFLAAVACLTVEAVCDLQQPTIMARIIDEGVTPRDLAVVLRLGVWMLGVAGIGALGAIGRNIIASLVSFRFAARLRDDLFRRITSFSFDELDRFDTASLITRQTNDVTQVQGFVNGLMRILREPKGDWRVHTCTNYPVGGWEQNENEPGRSSRLNGQSREANLARLVESLPSQPTVDQITRILRNHAEPGPMCQHVDNNPAGYQTVMSYVIDPNNGDIYAAYHNPCKHKYVRYSLG